MPTQQSIRALQRDESRPSIRRLEGKIAIITGGSCGIGEAMVKLFVKHGAKVIIADVQKARGTDLASSLYPSATFVYCDVRSEESIKNMIDLTITRYGKIDILINNAGILGDQKHRKSIVNFDPNEFDQIMQVNVRGTALGMKYAARAMMKRRSGCIISVASVAGVMGGMGPHPYTSSKHAIVGLTKNVACELGAYGIRVNCISPFGVATNMLVNALGGGEDEEEAEEETNYSRENEKKVDEAEDFVRGLANIKGPTLRAEDIAEAALYLAGDESKYVSGHNLVVDGGVTTSRNMIGL